MKNPPNMRLMPRDLEVLKAVYEYRVLTHTQLTQLVFSNNHPSIATKRLYTLFHNGYLERLFLPVRGGVAISPTLYLLGKKGADQLSLSGEYLNFYWAKDHLKVGTLFLAHALAISEFRLKMTLACRAVNIPILEWQGERALKKDYDRVSVISSSGVTKQLPIVPDSYFVLQTTKGKRCFVLELDRGTMECKRFRTKVEGYTAYFESGAYKERYGTKSLRVLTVTESQRRMKNLKAITERTGGKSRFWFALLDTLTAENILTDTVWSIAQRPDQHTLFE
ncbi:MAG: replication-relaxation family protein [Nostocaceae cyanobacterium]|nr:replication-relaxation family protein [Nostocaceae cyanobacterium]